MGRRLPSQSLAHRTRTRPRRRPHTSRSLVRVETFQLVGEVLLDDAALELERRRDLVLLGGEVPVEDLEASYVLEVCQVLVDPLDRLRDERMHVLAAVQLGDFVLVERDQRDEVWAPVADDQRL